MVLWVCGSQETTIEKKTHMLNMHGAQCCPED
jgi:hypothetical protein